MDNTFPKMLFKAGGPHEIHGGKFDYRIVADDGEERDAMADGWSLTTDDAKAPAVVAVADDAPPTRAELETKAHELGIKFDGRTNDAKLGEKIAAKLAQKD